MRSKQSGFTLIEIAIVLVIIGLLLGGVMKAQELIASAKIKNMANDLNGISAAVYAYQDRYKAYPGDDGAAGGRWPGAPVGDNNGVVGTANDTTHFNAAPAGATENTKFWQHLRYAGFVGGDSASGDQPQNAAGGITGVQTGAGLPATPDMAGLVLCTSNLTGKIAEAIDRQFDDGLPDKGAIRAYDQAKTAVTRGGTNYTRTTGNLKSVSNGGAGYNSSDETFLYTLCKSL